jgi:hypothetical protein
MQTFTLQSVDPKGFVVHALTVPAAHLSEAQDLARRLAASLIVGGPNGKDWSGWAVEVLDLLGRCRARVAMTTDPVEESEPIRLRA